MSHSECQNNASRFARRLLNHRILLIRLYAFKLYLTIYVLYICARVAEVRKTIGNSAEGATAMNASLSVGDLVVVPQNLKNGGYLFRVKVPMQTAGTIGIYAS